jgi:hypothetical protein
MSTSRFDVSDIINDLGETIVIYNITNQNLDDWGDEGTISTASSSITAVVQEIEAEDSEVTAGIANPDDLRVFIDDSVSATYVKENNRIVRSSTNYRIIQVTANPGHYEVIAKREL